MALLGDDLPARRRCSLLVARPDLCLATNEMNCVTLSGSPCCPCSVRRAACTPCKLNANFLFFDRGQQLQLRLNFSISISISRQSSRPDLNVPSQRVSSRSCCRCCRSSAALIAAGASRARCGHKANQIATIVRNMLINFCCTFLLLPLLSASHFTFIKL